MAIKQYEHTCDYCGKEHMISSSVFHRLKDGRQKTCYCSKECANNAKHTGYYIKCDNCGRMFYRRKAHIDRQNKINGKQFCSTECEFEFIRKESVEIRKCEICGKEYVCKKTSTQRFCSIICQGRWQSTYLCKDENFIKIHREIALNNLRSGKVSTVNSKPQKILDKLLNDNNIAFEREYKAKQYSIDTYLHDYNLMIEVMGDFWHCNPCKYNEPKYDMQIKHIERDKRKHDYIKKEYGIEILYLWEHDLMNNVDKCFRLIMEYIDNNGVLQNYHSFNYDSDVVIDCGY